MVRRTEAAISQDFAEQHRRARATYPAAFIRPEPKAERAANILRRCLLCRFVARRVVIDRNVGTLK